MTDIIDTAENLLSKFVFPLLSGSSRGSMADPVRPPRSTTGKKI